MNPKIQFTLFILIPLITFCLGVYIGFRIGEGKGDLHSMLICAAYLVGIGFLAGILYKVK